MKFEEAMERLEKITGELEQGNLSLDSALERFEEGMKLIGFCEKRLEEAEKKIQVLIQEGDKLRLKNWEERKVQEKEKSRGNENLKKEPPSDSLFRDEEN